MFGNFVEHEPLAAPLSTAPPGPTPCNPCLFLGSAEWFVGECGDVLRNDLIFSTNAKAIHPLLQGKIEELQLPILNYLRGKDVLNLSKALRGGSTIVLGDELMARNEIGFLEDTRNGIGITSQAYRGVIITDIWFGNMGAKYRMLANNIRDILRNMYHSGCSVVVAAASGVFTIPRQLGTIFNFDSQWEMRAYTKRSISKTEVGKTILGDSFPRKEVFTKGHYISAPRHEALFVEFINPADYECSDSEIENDPVPEPKTDSPVVIHFGQNGGSISYFGFVNIFDVSFGAIVLRLVNAGR